MPPLPRTPRHTHARPPRRARRTARILALAGLVALAAAVAVRAWLPVWLTAYVNRALADIPGYAGSIRDIDVALFRGAYVIHDLRVQKEANGIPVPFIAIEAVDLSVQWGALLRGAVVGDVTLKRPVVNFARGADGSSAQTGADADWTRPIRALMPLDINWIEINEGRVTFQDFSASPPIDLFIDDLHLQATNVRNVEAAGNPLPSRIALTGRSSGGGRLAVDGRINLLRPLPDLALEGHIEGVALPALNAYTRDLLAVDFAAGTLGVYTELGVRDGEVNGFVKPLATDVEVIEVASQDANPLNLAWEAVVSALVTVFKNHPKDQVATQIPLRGRIQNPEIGFWPTLAGIVHNAFIKAYSRTAEPE